MAAYAAVVSLMNIIDNIHNHPHLSTSFHKNQIESLGEKLDFLLNFVESYNSDGGISKEEVEDLESHIASAAHAAEDVIESHVVDRILGGSTKNSPSFLLDLQKNIEDMDSIKEKVIKVKEDRGFNDEQPIYAMPAASSRPLITGKTTMVGFDDYLIQLLDGLTGQQSNRQIIPIVGMGGIGKTTLARNVYENLVVMQHFDIRAWVTVSQRFNVREILLQTLSCLREYTKEMDERTEDQLGEQLHKVLYGRRYLIILDDMWSIEAWNKISFFFPNNYNRSRIIVTTRLLDVANHFGSLGLVVDFLDDDRSWNLFCMKAFAQEVCPPELEEIGKKIVKRCKGLPLSIVVIGGLLGKSSRMQEYWGNVAKDISSILNLVDDKQCLKILSLSYNYLPACLKPCFLYLGIFPEDREIHVSRLIKLWVAEGFIKPNKDQSLEEIAEGYIKDLVDRSLILVHSLGSNGKFKTCYIHDLLRDLCLRVAKKEKFLCVMRVLDTPRERDKHGRIEIHESSSEEEYHHRVIHASRSASFAGCLIHEGGLLSLKSRLLRVLIDVYTDSLDATFQQVNLRFLACEYSNAPIGWGGTYELPSSISLLWHVQTLIITGRIIKLVAPSEIWKMPQLRHLEFNSICLPDPPPSDENDDFILRSLHTLMTVFNFRCSEEVCKRIPNIKKLHIDFSGEVKRSLYNVGRLSKLESLNCYFCKVPNRDYLLQNLTFPSSLKKLTLTNCGLHWNDLTMIGSLLHLEVLKLDKNSVVGPEWNPVEGEFLHLKFLKIEYCPKLIYWNADSSHFPALENLVLDHLWELDEIPSGIGEIPTLQAICVFNCSVSAAISAIEILEEQESLGNQGLQVRVRFWDLAKLEKFREKVELRGFTSHNFQIEGV